MQCNPSIGDCIMHASSTESTQTIIHPHSEKQPRLIWGLEPSTLLQKRCSTLLIMEVDIFKNYLLFDMLVTFGKKLGTWLLKEEKNFHLKKQYKIFFALYKVDLQVGMKNSK